MIEGLTELQTKAAKALATTYGEEYARDYIERTRLYNQGILPDYVIRSLDQRQLQMMIERGKHVDQARAELARRTGGGVT